MTFQIDTAVTCYLLPEDRIDARSAFLGILHNPEETWLIAYGFTMVDLVDEILAAHTKGIAIHLYLDHTQAGGTMEKPLVQKLVDGGVDVTIGTSDAGKKYICHTKGIVTLDGHVWTGSVNFSESGWYQVNSALEFTCADYANKFIAQFETLRSYADQHEAAMQLKRRSNA